MKPAACVLHVVNEVIWFFYIAIEIIIKNSFQPGGVQYHNGK